MRRGFTAIVLGAALSCSTLALAGVSQGATSGCLATPAPAPMSVTVPPELQLLIQKMKQVRFATIRLSAQTVLATEEGKLILGIHSELRRSPRESFTTATTQEVSSSSKSARQGEKVIEIGGVSYRYERPLTHEDGGRPWVSERSRPSSKANSLEPSLSQLAEAESIVAMGTESLGGQQVSRFVVTFAPGTYPESDLPFGELLGEECPQPVRVELAIAPSGLPIEVEVSTGYTKAGKTITTSSTTRILATNFHFTPLKPPPAKRTISQAALRRLREPKVVKEVPKHKPRRRPKH